MIKERENYCNIAYILKRIAEKIPEETALVTKTSNGYAKYSFREILHQSNLYAAALSSVGISSGSRTMLMVKPSMEFVTLAFALFQLGAHVILIDPGMGYKNLLRCIGKVKPATLIGIPKAQFFSRLFPKAFSTVKTRICVGLSFGVLGRSLTKLSRRVKKENIEVFKAGDDDIAAIIFTTGSTGPPKGVQYTHRVFHAQLGLIRDFYKIGPGEVDQPCFPLFALFSTALGAKAVIPQMDPAHPAKVKPKIFVRSLLDNQVTYSFGSPAIWNVVSNYCLDKNISLPLKQVLMAGAPVPGELIRRMKKIMHPKSEIHTPYGATESLPISSITGTEILENTLNLSQKGKGTCVGRPLPGVDIRIIEPRENVIATWQETKELPTGSIGEIVVRGAIVTKAYDYDLRETELAKIVDGPTFWHRMGDMGYLDNKGRLWFCGRKDHRVFTKNGVLYTIPCEALFNNHPHVFRSALVGVGEKGKQQPVIIVEPVKKSVHNKHLLEELAQIAKNHDLTQNITTFLMHPSFPVDIRHNAKIFREQLANWAEIQLNRRKSPIFTDC